MRLGTERGGDRPWDREHNEGFHGLWAPGYTVSVEQLQRPHKARTRALSFKQATRNRRDVPQGQRAW